MTHEEADEKIINLLDDEFLNKLLEVGKLYGWSGDYVEIGNFIEELHRKKGITIPNEDLQCYELE